MIIRPLDIGYQITKLMRKVDGKWEYFSMPSLAPLHTGFDMGESFLQKRDTIIVDVDGTKYEIGPDANDLDDSDTIKALDESFIFTEQYKAMYLGSLNFIGEDVIDLLVVGLPVTNLKNADNLKNILQGEHVINENKTVNVKDVLVIPQPLGSLYAALNSNDEDLEDMAEEYNLIIDPGSLTYDFLFTNGKVIIEKRSDAYHGGMLKVLNAIAQSISKEHGKPFKNIKKIEKALEKEGNERTIKLPWQKEKEDLTKHIINTKSIIDNPITFMKNKVGDGTEQEIDNIIIGSGGAKIYKKAISKKYPDFEVKVLDDITFKGLDVKNYSTIYSNVTGFLFAGCEKENINIEEIE